MVVLIVVAVVCFLAGVIASSWWLPDLAEGPVGAIAFFVVCGLSGGALGLVGIHLDSMVRELEHPLLPSRFDAEIVGNSLTEILWEAGSVAGLALIAYLLAPKPEQPPAGGQPSR